MSRAMKSQKEQRRATKSNEKQQKATKSNRNQQRTPELEKPKRARKSQDEQRKAQKVQMETRFYREKKEDEGEVFCVPNTEATASAINNFIASPSAAGIRLHMSNYFYDASIKLINH